MRPPHPSPVVLLLTCERFDLTLKTLETFRLFNPDRWVCYWADDASTDYRTMESLCTSHGFKAIVKHDVRAGCTRTTCEAMQKICQIEGDNHIVMYLQNDFEFLRRVPVDVCREILSHPEVGLIRTSPRYGGGLSHAEKFLANEIVHVGWASFTFNPCPIMLTQTAAKIFNGQTCERRVAGLYYHLHKKTAIFNDPIVFHIGGDLHFHRPEDRGKGGDHGWHGSQATPGGIFQ